MILDSPARSVMEGSEVTLRCWYQKRPLNFSLKPPSNLPAYFYKDGTLISSTSTENMTIHSVNKTDGGFYKCVIPGRGESPQSWMDVRGESYITREQTWNLCALWDSHNCSSVEFVFFKWTNKCMDYTFLIICFMENSKEQGSKGPVHFSEGWGIFII